MQNNDNIRFLAVISAMDEFYNRVTEKPALRIFWADLIDYDIADIEAACAAHRKDPDHCAFFPKSGDIIRQIRKLANNDGRIDWAEAFAVCIAATDERKTLVWSDEMREAWFSVSELYQLDKIAAKQSFKSIYERLVCEARAKRAAVRYSVSLGGSESHQREVLELAVKRGQLSFMAAKKVCPALDAPAASNVVPLMLAGSCSKNLNKSEIKSHIAKLRAAIDSENKQIEPVGVNHESQ
jgi:hypothetical protein